MHSRQKIREAIVSLLKGNTDAGDNVLSNSEVPIQEGDLPAIRIYTLAEDVQFINNAHQQYERKLSLNIEATTFDQNENDLENKMDDLAEQIETIIGNNELLKDTVAESDLVSVKLESATNGRVPIGSVTLNYEVLYYTSKITQLVGDDLGTVDTGWKMNSDEENASDEITMGEE